MSKTKIVCTLGPSTSSEETIRKLARKGMDVARLNFSHGRLSDHARMISLVKKVRRELGVPIAILADLQGPRIRTGVFKSGKAELKRGSTVLVNSESDFVGSGREFSIPYARLSKEVGVGDRIFIDGGLIELLVVGKKNGVLAAEVVEGGEVGDHKGVNLPNADISLNSLTRKDLRDLKFLQSQNADYVAQSFVRVAGDVMFLKKKLSRWKLKPKVIAKIETAKALYDIDAIIDESDGIMIARGDLGIELNPEEVPLIQKSLIKKCNAAFKPVITATQMLESMTYSPIPTRAEASDVANAVLDGTDALMLSGETAMGKYPLKAVETMDSIAKKAEFVLTHAPHFDSFEGKPLHHSIVEAISGAVTHTAFHLKAKFIVAYTTHGTTARLISKHKPPQKIIAFTPHESARNQCALLWGVEPLLLRKAGGLEDFTRMAETELKARKLVKKGDLLVLTAGIPLEVSGNTNVMKVHVVNGF
ncbi:MAG: pyruvate kinase [Candidatus Norongarragalinales archaeon]